MSDRNWHIRMARTYLHQAAVVRRQGIHHAWHATLMGWVAKRRLLAMQVTAAPVAGEPAQLELFGAMNETTT
jgi:hypothetical protein